MKQFGCILEFTDDRNADLMRRYRALLAAADRIVLSEIAESLVNSPSRRFWVSEERASVVVSAIMAGKPVLDTMRPTKREMFTEIHRRVVKMMRENPRLSRYECVCAVVASPAPKFYMTPLSALETISKFKKGYYDRRFKRV